MLRVLLYLFLVAALAAGAVWLAERPGEVLITWQQWRIETSLAVLAVALLAAVALLVALWMLVRAVVRAPGALRGWRRTRRGARGYQALSQGLIAVGSGDARSARRFADEAHRIAPGEPLTLLLAAQSAQLAGDRAGAETIFKQMAARADTQALGLHGLFIEARRRGDAAAARLMAEEAAQSAAAPAWAAQAVLEFRSAAGDWPGALHQLARNGKLGLLDKPAHQRQRAVLLTAQALAAEDGDRDFARERVLEALRLAPTLVPAAALAGRMLGEAGELRKAARIIETAWRAEPHPDLAEAYAHLRPGDSARDRLARVETLAAKAPGNPAGQVEGALAVARAAIDAREFAVARRALEPLTARPTRRIAELMAALEELESGDVGRAREWMARALHARRDPAWTADGFVSDHWLPVSPVTGRLDAFEWKDPLAELAAPESDVENARAPAMMIDAVQAPAPQTPPPQTPASQELPAEPAASEQAMRPAAHAWSRQTVSSHAAPAGAPEAAEAAPDTAVERRAPRIIPLPHVPDDPGPEPDRSDDPAAEPADAPAVEWSAQGWRKLKELFR